MTVLDVTSVFSSFPAITFAVIESLTRVVSVTLRDSGVSQVKRLRWLLRVLLKGYTKSRRYGGWSNPRREAYLEQCCKQLDAVEARLSPRRV